VCTVGSTNSTCTNVRRCTSQGDEYLSLLVPEILNSAVFNTRNALLFITWDEGNNCVYVGQTYPMCIDRVPAILAGPHVRRGYVSNTGLSHYSLVKTLEVAWSLPSFTTLDANANPMTEFLAPQARLDFESITDFSHYFFIRTLEVTSTFPWRPAVPFLRSSMTTLLDLRLQRD